MRAILFPALCCFLLLPACDTRQAAVPAPIDFAAEALPFTIAPIVAPDALPGGVALSLSGQLDVALLRAFFSQHFAALDRMLAEARTAALAQGDEDHALRRFIEGVRASGLAGIDACMRWLEAMPDSYVAHLSCGAMWGSAAWDARSTETADKVTPARFALMRERFARANALLERALTLTPQPIEALAMLASNHFGMDDKKSAHAFLERAEALAPAYSSLHEVRINFALPEWGGSSQKVVAAIDRATKAGVAEDRLRDFHDEFVARPWRLTDPGAERTYWESAIARQSSFYRLDGLVKYFQRVGNWRDGVPAASRLIAAYPDYADGYWMRALGHERLGEIPAALADYRAAASRGHDAAIQALIQAYIQGGLGLPPKDWMALDSVCRYGAGCPG